MLKAAESKWFAAQNDPWMQSRDKSWHRVFALDVSLTGRRLFLVCSVPEV